MFAYFIPIQSNYEVTSVSDNCIQSERRNVSRQVSQCHVVSHAADELISDTLTGHNIKGHLGQLNYIVLFSVNSVMFLHNWSML